MKKAITMFVVLAIPVLFAGCIGIFDCGEDIIPVSYISEENTKIRCTFQNIDREEEEVLLTIQNKADFDLYLLCNDDFPEIDFDEQFLVIGRVRSYNCGYLKDQKFNSKCSRTDYEITIQGQNCAAINEVFFGAVIPKEFEDEKFRLTIKNQ